MTFSPRHKLVNLLKISLEIQECNSQGQPLLGNLIHHYQLLFNNLKPNQKEMTNLFHLGSFESCHLHFQSSEHYLRTRVLNGYWSPPFSISSVGRIFLPLLSWGQYYDDANLISVKVSFFFFCFFFLFPQND